MIRAFIILFYLGLGFVMYRADLAEEELVYVTPVYEAWTSRYV